MGTDRGSGATRHMLEVDDLGPSGVEAVLALAERDPAGLPRPWLCHACPQRCGSDHARP